MIAGESFQRSASLLCLTNDAPAGVSSVMGEMRMMLTMSAEPRRVLDLRQDLAVALQGFELHGSMYSSMGFGPVRLDLMRHDAHRVSIEMLSTDERYAGLGLANFTLRTLTCFADATGWTLLAEPRRAGAGMDQIRLMRMFERHGFTGTVALMVRTPLP